MVLGKGHLNTTRGNSSRFISRKLSRSSVTLYIFALFAFSIYFLYFNSRSVEESVDGLSLDLQRMTHPNVRINWPENENMWKNSRDFGLVPCVQPSKRYGAFQGSDRYLTVRCNGGLNQMRFGIADMVTVAHIMNATLVIPQLDRRSFWQDSSAFSDIFDEYHFIDSLKNDVKIVKELPKELESVPRARKHFSLWSGMSYYEETAALFNDYKVIHAAKTDSRLANNDWPSDIQRLRCRALYHGLQFAPPIRIFAEKLVKRLRSRDGRYIALHLRYEKDMLAFTGCTYGLSPADSEELQILRETTKHWKVKRINSTDQRLSGLCPLTPKEVGIFFQALGYPSSTVIYVAAGNIYGNQSHLVHLIDRYPNIVFKESLASKKELEAFSRHASMTAALDYVISVESDIFIPSYSGNMARAVEGHRRIMGHRKTITPDRKGLVELFDKIDGGELKEGPELSNLVREMHKNREGSPRKRRGPSPGVKGRSRFKTEEFFYENPYPECICKKKKYNS